MHEAASREDDRRSHGDDICPRCAIAEAVETRHEEQPSVEEYGADGRESHHLELGFRGRDSGDPATPTEDRHQRRRDERDR